MENPISQGVHPAVLALAKIRQKEESAREGAVDTLRAYIPSARRDAELVLKLILDPTREMLEAGCASHPEKPYGSETTLVEIIESEWRAMILTALEQLK